MNKRILIGVGVVAIIAIVFAIGRGGAVTVNVAVVQRDTLSVTVGAEGRTRARDRFTVAAPISGRVTRLDVREGDVVDEGQLLTRIFAAPDDPRVVATARAEVEAAEARLRETEARVGEAALQAEQAEREVERRRPLFEMGAITRERMEQAELAARVANQRLESAQAALSSARAALEGARARLLGADSADPDVAPVDVRAPGTGRVVHIPDESERVVAAGSPLLELAGGGGLEVVLDVLSEDAVRVAPGNDLVITGWGGEGVLRGTIRTVTRVGYTVVSALGVEEQRVDVIGDLRDVPTSLGTGYRVSGEIVVWHGEDVLTAPTSAIFRTGETWQVFVVEDGRARRREIVIGNRNEHAVEVREGLSEGDRVIVFPPEEVEDGVGVSADNDSGG